MTQKQFEDFLEECYREINEKQKLLNKEYHLNTYTKYLFNHKAQTIQFENDENQVLKFEIACIGSWAPKDKVWIWAWANDDFTQAIRDEGSKLKDLGKLTGHQVFTREGFECEEIVARDLAYMSIHQLEAIGIYRIEAEDSYVFLAIKKVKNDDDITKTR